MRKVVYLALVGMMVFGLAGCSGNSAPQSSSEAAAKGTEALEGDRTSDKSDREEKEPDAATDLKGSVILAGSTSMEKFSNALAESFMEKYPDVTVQAEFTGSSAGVEAVLAGQCDIGNSSRNLKDEEMQKGAIENIVAIDGIAVVSDPKNSVTDLSADQLRQIYKGSATNWKELGGADQPIVVVGREAGSGTRGAFEEILKVENECKYANELSSTGEVMAKVASTPGAIGYVSLDVVDDTVKVFAIDGIVASEAEIKSGDYLLSRPFVMATTGEIAEQNDLVKALFDYIYSDEGEELIRSVGLITVE